ncbi:hypothetical protein VP01_1051g2 [Puccinia sorghi]|uniref:Uncharacterized protein n=1 Tax=Puccinia sorghi TaxID=27349 RepID=A0A0L6VU48_9BASI|nr:hypothetical protein VP01_1051g2 [Puccinia sorghi]
MSLCLVVILNSFYSQGIVSFIFCFRCYSWCFFINFLSQNLISFYLVYINSIDARDFIIAVMSKLQQLSSQARANLIKFPISLQNLGSWTIDSLKEFQQLNFPLHCKKNMLNFLQLTCRNSQEASVVTPTFPQDLAGACCMSKAGILSIFFNTHIMWKLLTFSWSNYYKKYHMISKLHINLSLLITCGITFTCSLNPSLQRTIQMYEHLKDHLNPLERTFFRSHEALHMLCCYVETRGPPSSPRSASEALYNISRPFFLWIVPQESTIHQNTSIMSIYNHKYIILVAQIKCSFDCIIIIIHSHPQFPCLIWPIIINHSKPVSLFTCNIPCLSQQEESKSYTVNSYSITFLNLPTLRAQPIAHNISIEPDTYLFWLSTENCNCSRRKEILKITKNLELNLFPNWFDTTNDIQNLTDATWVDDLETCLSQSGSICF